MRHDELTASIEINLGINELICSQTGKVRLPPKNWAMMSSLLWKITSKAGGHPMSHRAQCCWLPAFSQSRAKCVLRTMFKHELFKLFKSYSLFESSFSGSLFVNACAEQTVDWALPHSFPSCCNCSARTLLLPGFHCLGLFLLCLNPLPSSELRLCFDLSVFDSPQNGDGHAVVSGCLSLL